MHAHSQYITAMYVGNFTTLVCSVRRSCGQILLLLWCDIILINIVTFKTKPIISSTTITNGFQNIIQRNIILYTKVKIYNLLNIGNIYFVFIFSQTLVLNNYLFFQVEILILTETRVRVCIVEVLFNEQLMLKLNVKFKIQKNTMQRY